MSSPRIRDKLLAAYCKLSLARANRAPLPGFHGALPKPLEPGVRYIAALVVAVLLTAVSISIAAELVIKLAGSIPADAYERPTLNDIYVPPTPVIPSSITET